MRALNMKLWLALAFLISISAANAQLVLQRPNDGSTGTTLNLLATQTNATTGAAINALTTTTAGILGVTIGNAGTTGNALIAYGGDAQCSFDGSNVSNNWAIASTTAAGKCHDSGTAASPTNAPPAGAVGISLSTNSGVGVYSITMRVQGAGGSGSGSGTINSSSVSNFAYYSGATTVSGATIAANAIPKSNGASAPTASLITDNGSVTAIAEGALTTPFGLTDGASIAVNAFLSNNFTVTLAGNRTLANPTNTTAGQWLDFVITQDGTGSRTLAFGAGYLNAAGGAFTVSLNSAAAAVTEIGCKVTATAPTLICYGPVNSATSQAQVSAPVAPANTTTYFMQGLAGTITPKTTGAVIITISGTVVDPSGTAAGNGIIYQLSYGTGSAPANAAALAGTQIGTTQSYTSPTTVIAADTNVPFSTTAVVTGLTVGTAYWIDLAAKSVATVSSMGLANVSVTAIEVR